MLLTDDNHVKLETTLEKFLLDLSSDGIESNIGSSTNFFSHYLRIVVGVEDGQRQVRGHRSNGPWNFFTTNHLSACPCVSYL